jgi:carbonic anhydrase
MSMSQFDAVRERNAAFAESGGHTGLVMMPRLLLTVLTCLDPRVDPAQIFGLRLGDAAVVRNAGGRVTPEVVEDLAFIGLMAETARPEGPLFEVVVVHHSGCGTALLADDGVRARYAERIGAEPEELAARAVVEPGATVREDVARLRASAAIPDRVTVSGHVYDVETGLVRTVVDAGSGSSPLAAR